MKNRVPPLNWRAELADAAEIDSIDNDFILLNTHRVPSAFLGYPFKLDVTVAAICLRGTAKGAINLQSYAIQAPCLTIVLPNQIIQYEYISEDFSGLFIIMSRRFTDNLNIQGWSSLFLSIRNDPFIPLTKEVLESMVNYYNMMRRTIQVNDNPYRLSIAKHLTKAFFYGAGYHFHKKTDDEKASKNEILLRKFFNYAEVHYKEQRGVAFYADKLCLTAKYLSTAIKEISGITASDWIDNYVVLEAKALLKSTNMTIQQISDELNFPSQSFFGKYFKRHVGVSPKEYKKS